MEIGKGFVAPIMLGLRLRNSPLDGAPHPFQGSSTTTPGSVQDTDDEVIYVSCITHTAIHIETCHKTPEICTLYISSHVATCVATRFFFLHAEILKSGYFMQIYSNQSVLCRNIGQVPLRVTQSCAADYLDRTKPNQTPPECPAAMKRQVTL